MQHKEAGEVLRGIIEGVTAFTRHEVGMYKGFQVFVQKDMMGPVLFLQGEKEYEKPFPYEELLKENITRQMEIDAELEIKDQEECVEVQEETKNLPCQTAVR